MMRNKAYELSKWPFSVQDRILPDANFWVNVFGPAPTVGQRSRGLQVMLQGKVAIR